MTPSRKRKRQKMKKQYEEILTRITADLEKGIVPWEKPWCLRGEGIVSHSTGHGYSLLNCMLLDRPGEYLTFAQAKKEGGMVKKGAKSSAIFFYRQIAIRKDEDGKEPEEPKTVPYLEKFRVFHIDDCEGIEPKYADRWKDVKETRENGSDEDAERVARGYMEREGIRIFHGGDRACYSPATDSVTLPKAGHFADDASYYATLFHELGHSTGAPERLDRKIRNTFGNSLYAREELVAEICSAFVTGRLGLDTGRTRRNAAAYIQDWKRKLSDDPAAIVWAASRAEKAANLILGK